MSDVCIERIKTTLSELQELVELIAKNSPETPEILYKITLEKGESLCEQVRAFITDNKTVAAAAVMPDKVIETNIPVSADALASDTSTGVDGKEDELKPEEKKDSVQESSSFSWDTSDDDFCLFDGIIPTKKSSDAPAAEDEKNEESAKSSSKEVETPAAEDSVSDDSSEIVFDKENETSASENVPPIQGKELETMMNINDRFLFRRELFDGDGELMASVIDALNHITSYEASLTYLHTHFAWDFESETVGLLCMLIQQRFE